MPTATAAITTVRADLLDGVQANLAVLADHHHGPDSHLALGAALRFQPRAGAGGLPTVEPAIATQLAEADHWTGLVTRATWRGVTGADLARLTDRHDTLYAVADAYQLPWLPYFGQRHMDHSFLVERAGGRALITDAYHNQTQWGLASPGRWELDWPELPTASLVVLLEPARTGMPGVAPLTQLGSVADYITAYANHPDRVAALDRLAVETWLLARSRKLHAAFRVWSGELQRPDVLDHLDTWDRVAGQTFLALRRARRGKPVPDGLLPALAAALAADQAVFEGQPCKESRSVYSG
jgi:hypothetical protein